MIVRQQLVYERVAVVFAGHDRVFTDGFVKSSMKTAVCVYLPALAVFTCSHRGRRQSQWWSGRGINNMVRCLPRPRVLLTGSRSSLIAGQSVSRRVACARSGTALPSSSKWRMSSYTPTNSLIIFPTTSSLTPPLLLATPKLLSWNVFVRVYYSTNDCSWLCAPMLPTSGSWSGRNQKWLANPVQLHWISRASGCLLHRLRTRSMCTGRAVLSESGDTPGCWSCEGRALRPCPMIFRSRSCAAVAGWKFVS